MGELTRYEHHGKSVVVDKDLKGTHRSHCLCFRCANFQPGTVDNCLIAQAVFANCVKFGLTTPVYECPDFAAKDPLDVPVTADHICQDCRMLGGIHAMGCRAVVDTNRHAPGTFFGQGENPYQRNTYEWHRWEDARKETGHPVQTRRFSSTSFGQLENRGEGEDSGGH